MNIFYCDFCDRIIVREGKSTDEIPQYHYLDGELHPLFYMDYLHPDHRVCEAEGIIRHRIETFGLSGAIEQVLFEGEIE